MNTNSRRRRRYGLVAVLAASAVGAAGGGLAVASIPSTANGQITGCVNKSTGAVRIVDYQAGKRCAGTETTFNWSKGWRYRGAWSSTSAYAVLDVVTYGGASYLAKAASTGKAPSGTSTYWGLLAARGAPGARGPAGVTQASITGNHNYTYDLSSNWTTLLTKTLPAGSWAITATIPSVGGFIDNDLGAGWGECQLVGPGGRLGESADGSLTGPEDGAFVDTSLTLIAGVTLTGPSDVSVWCHVGGGVTSAMAGPVQLLALQVGHLDAG